MPLKPFRVSVTIPSEFRSLLDERKAEEHIPSDSKFLLSLLLFDLSSRCAHKVTREIVNGPEAKFYRAVDKIVTEFPNLKGKKGRKASKWLIERMKEIMADAEGEKSLLVDGTVGDGSGQQATADGAQG